MILCLFSSMMFYIKCQQNGEIKKSLGYQKQKLRHAFNILQMKSIDKIHSRKLFYNSSSISHVEYELEMDQMKNTKILCAKTFLLHSFFFCFLGFIAKWIYESDRKFSFYYRILITL